MSDLRIVAGNLHAGAGNQGNEKAGIALDLMEQQGARVGVWTEAKTAVKPFRRNAMRVLGENPKPRVGKVLPEQGDTVVTVDKVKIRRWWIAVQTLLWIMRKYQQWHEGRRDVVAMLTGPVRGVRAVHLPPGGPGSVNGDAWRAQMDDALRWGARRGCRVVVGDVNANAVTVDQYAADRGYDVRVVGFGVDVVMVFNGTAEAKNLGKPGPDFDHPAVRYDVTASRPLTHRRRKRK